MKNTLVGNHKVSLQRSGYRYNDFETNQGLKNIINTKKVFRNKLSFYCKSVKTTP